MRDYGLLRCERCDMKIQPDQKFKLRVLGNNQYAHHEDQDICVRWQLQRHSVDDAGEWVHEYRFVGAEY